jgi:DNA-binding XRE family transcriptional regulator
MKLDLQFIDSPRGERLVVLPETQYHILKNAAATLSAMQRAQQETGTVPDQVKRRISGGESPVRAIREWRGLSGAYLARLAGITPSMLSQIERTGKTGSTRTIKAIAEVLGVPIDVVVSRVGPA